MKIVFTPMYKLTKLGVGPLKFSTTITTKRKIRYEF